MGSTAEDHVATTRKMQSRIRGPTKLGALCSSLVISGTLHRSCTRNEEGRY